MHLISSRFSISRNNSESGSCLELAGRQQWFQERPGQQNPEWWKEHTTPPPPTPHPICPCLPSTLPSPQGEDRRRAENRSQAPITLYEHTLSWDSQLGDFALYVSEVAHPPSRSPVPLTHTYPCTHMSICPTLKWQGTMQGVNLQLQQDGVEDHQGREQRSTQGPAQGARSQETGSGSGSQFKGWAQVVA